MKDKARFRTGDLSVWKTKFHFRRRK